MKKVLLVTENDLFSGKDYIVGAFKNQQAFAEWLKERNEILINDFNGELEDFYPETEDSYNFKWISYYTI